MTAQMMYDAVTGTAIDHTKISDAASSDFGAAVAIMASGRIYGLTDATGALTNAGNTVTGTLGLYVSGPRALRKPVLTTIPAWNKGFFSVGTGNTYTGNAAIDLRARTTSTTLAASATVPASLAGTYSNKMAQDDYQVTYDATGVAVATPAKVTGVLSRTDTAKLQYQLAPIPANMTAGTYVVMLLAAKKSSAGVVPKAMSLALTTFNVGQATEEKKIAFGCPDCHSTTVWHDNAVKGINEALCCQNGYQFRRERSRLSLDSIKLRRKMGCCQSKFRIFMRRRWRRRSGYSKAGEWLRSALYTGASCQEKIDFRREWAVR